MKKFLNIQLEELTQNDERIICTFSVSFFTTKKDIKPYVNEKLSITKFINLIRKRL